MTQSLRALMEKAIDYAGLFPPAVLPMEKAVEDYHGYRECPDSWMLSRFICPTSRLVEFENAYAKLSGNGKPYRISALGRKAEGPDNFHQCIQEDIVTVKQFVGRNANKVIVDAFEFCLPPGLASQPEELVKILDNVNKAIIQHSASPNPVTVYYEVTLTQSWQEELNTAIRAIAEQSRTSISQSTSEDLPVVGFKFRCGGINAEQFPSVEQVVYCIKTCINEGVRLKLTAGLHHPFRHFNKSVQTKMHGFISIFAAVILGREHKLDEAVLTGIVEDEDHSNFQFKGQSLSWKDLSITTDQITEGRNNAIISYGCCDFNGPREDLRRLGFL